MQIFGCQSIVSLARLLPGTQNLDNPPITSPYALKKAKIYVNAIAYFIKKDGDEALKVATQEVVKIAELLVPYLLVTTDVRLQENVANTLHAICTCNESELNGTDNVTGKSYNYNGQILIKYCEKYGDVKDNFYSTNLSNEIQTKFPKLSAIVDQMSTTEQENMEETSYEEGETGYMDK